MGCACGSCRHCMGMPVLFRWRVWYRLTTKLWLSWWRFNPHNNGSSISKQRVWPKDLRFLLTTVYFFFFLLSFRLINFSASPTHFQSSTSICFSFKFVLYFFSIYFVLNSSWNWSFLSISSSFDFFYMSD